MNIVELNNVSLVRQGIQILSDISWTVARGEHWALLGANGAGKTTLLKVITGYEWPTTGSVTVLRQRYGDCSLRELRKTIGWVSSAIEQDLPPADSTLDVVVSSFYASMGLYEEPTPIQWRQAEDVLRHVGGGHVLSRPFGSLSQGERQRALIARALVNRPVLVILDEPCAGLDPAAREAFLADLEQWAKSPVSPGLVLVTHHIEEIGPWIDHVLVIKNGRLLTSGRTQDVLTSEVLGEAFGCHCTIEQFEGRYWLRVLARVASRPRA
jgi:iron complex transport system ATP-binding protein